MQGQALRDNAAQFAELGAVILGASFDTPAENLAFAEAQDFPFRLLSDVDRSVGAAYGVVRPADDTYAYVWGGNGRQDGGYDCSGLTSAVYRRLGISLPRTAAQQQQVGTGIERGELKVGDLIFYGTPAYHVAIYAGNGWMVSADNTVDGINFEPIYGSPSNYRRIQ